MCMCVCVCVCMCVCVTCYVLCAVFLILFSLSRSLLFSLSRSHPSPPPPPCRYLDTLLRKALLGEDTEGLRTTLKELLENMITLRGQVRKFSDTVRV